MAEERIQKIMAEQGLCSRRAAEQIIAEGRVKVNGHPVKVGDKMDPNRDVLHVDDERIYIKKDQQLYYLALYKPRGYVTTASDELGRKTVMELVSDIPARLYPVGRLDKDSEGLLLMTNDGAFAQAVTHPSGGISKLYRVTVQPRADESQILKLSSGVVLDDGTKTMPCAINVVTDEPGRTVMEMTLKEGKNREIRRMCETVGLEVVRLKRNAEGVVKLGMLKPGTYRELTKAEINGQRRAAVQGRRAPPPRPGGQGHPEEALIADESPLPDKAEKQNSYARQFNMPPPKKPRCRDAPWFFLAREGLSARPEWARNRRWTMPCNVSVRGAFQLTPSARRATSLRETTTALMQRFQSTPSARRATLPVSQRPPGHTISIHALREESDQ